MRKLPLYSWIAFSLIAAANCQSQITDPGAQKICASIEQVELPAADQPSAKEKKALASCISQDLYFGLARPADPEKARQCAYAEIDRGDKGPIAGKAILMMVYANGKGAERNLDVALKLACTIGDSPGDAAGRVYQLDRLRKSPSPAAGFSVCDHSSGRVMYEACAILQERLDRPERDQKLNELIAGWNAADKRAFRVFLAEAEKYFKVQAANGVNLAGSFEIQEEIFLRNGLLDTLERFERGELPKFSAEEFHKAESAQNTAYLLTQSGKASQWGTVTPESIKTSQEEWLRYCDAWIRFGRQKYPAVSVESWKTWLDQERVTAFNRFLP